MGGSHPRTHHYTQHNQRSNTDTQQHCCEQNTTVAYYHYQTLSTYKLTVCVPIIYIPDNTYPLGLYLRWLGITYVTT